MDGFRRGIFVGAVIDTVLVGVTVGGAIDEDGCLDGVVVVGALVGIVVGISSRAAVVREEEGSWVAISRVSNIVGTIHGMVLVGCVAAVVIVGDTVLVLLHVICGIARTKL